MKNDDICFTHVLPDGSKLISAVKLLKRETRALVKRSSRADDLKKFKIEEMSSISTLEAVGE